MSVDAELVADRLPSYVTRFVGREEEIAELETMVKPGGLVNICGWADSARPGWRSS